MVTPARSAGRATDVLDFLAAHATAAFTLSELARALDLSPASLLAVLQALADAGYVERDPRRKTYVLGPALVGVGQAALDQHQVLDAARQELRRLSEDCDAEVVATVTTGGHISVLGAAGRRGRPPVHLRVGQRLPFAPPLGQVFLAWADRAEVESWYERAPGGIDRTTRRELERALNAIAERGYSVTINDEARQRLGDAVRQLADAPRSDALGATIRHLLAELRDHYEVGAVEARRRYPLGAIAGPVFGPAGEVRLAITLVELGEFDGREIRELGARLTDVTRFLTKLCEGREPSRQRPRRV